MSMNEAVKKNWVAALRSGKYEQGERAFRPDEDTYCCLGVLAETMGCTWNSGGPGSTLAFLGGRVVGSGAFDEDFLEEIGMSRDHEEDLINMNDGNQQAQASFAEIADYIEENL